MVEGQSAQPAFLIRSLYLMFVCSYQEIEVCVPARCEGHRPFACVSCPRVARAKLGKFWSCPQRTNVCTDRRAHVEVEP